MTAQISYYLDEHVPKAVADGLRRRGVSVLTAQEAEMIAANDQQHLELARQVGRVIVTQDTDFLRLHAAGLQHAGIIYIPQQTPVGVMIRHLMLIYDLLSPKEMNNHIEFL